MTAERPQYSADPVGWRVSTAPVDYEFATTVMERMVAEVHAGGQESVWLLEHPPLYTAGTSARAQDLVDPDRFPVYPSPRGGQYTYHGPGQRVAYLVLDLGRRRKDVRRFVEEAEAWIIDALDILGIEAGVRDGRVGVWVDRGDGREDKIAALGIRVRRWVTYHGIALNVAPDLSHFEGIVPCGIADERFGVTSIEALGHAVEGMAVVDDALRRAFEARFGPTEERAAPQAP